MLLQNILSDLYMRWRRRHSVCSAYRRHMLEIAYAMLLQCNFDKRTCAYNINVSNFYSLLNGRSTYRVAQKSKPLPNYKKNCVKSY